MNSIDTAKQVLMLVQALMPLMRRLWELLRKARPVPLAISYENVYLDLSLDLRDPTGKRAYVERKQRVIFRVNEAGVIRSIIWGDGLQLKRLLLRGVRRLGSRVEGPRRVVLLAMKRSAKKDSVQIIHARETLSNAFLRSEEYFEASVERPTRRLRLQVTFPKARPPRDVYLEEGSHRQRNRLPVRLKADGRAHVSWSMKAPRIDALYSLRWAW